uniref:CCHC-type domain-containing protein n=1 Tax=Strongyloides venezuelensis TaxID=75913 RepID=A0A0K0FRR7_STRVS
MRMAKSYTQIEKFDGTTPFKDFIRSLECVFTIEDVVDDVKKRAILMLYLSSEVYEVLDTIGNDQKDTYTALKNKLNDIYNGENQARWAGDQAKLYEFDYKNFEASLRRFLKLVKDGFPALGGKDLLATQISLLMQKIEGRMYDRLYTYSRQYQNAEDIVEDLVFAFRHNRRNRETSHKMEKSNFYTDLEKKFIGSMDRVKKCFNCHKEGHLARDCQKKVEILSVAQKSQVNSNLVEQLDEGVSGSSYKIELTVDGKRIKTHCDTGTPVSLMTRRFADDLGLAVENVMSEKISVKGVANDELKIDGNVYVRMKV